MKEKVSKNTEQKCGRRLLAVCLLLLMAATAVLFAGCTAKVTADISAYENTKITVKGLEDKAFTVTPKALAKLECIKETAEGKYEKAGTVTAVGPTLNTFLEKYGHKQDDFSRIIFKASDKYTTVLDKGFLQTYDTIIMGVEGDGEALSKKELPMRLLIPDADSGKWTKMVVEIEFVK